MSVEQITALQTALNNMIQQVTTKYGELDGAVLAHIEALRNALKGGADADNDTFEKLATRIDQLKASLDALDATYATDADLAARVAQINTAWADADEDVKTLLADKAGKAEVAAADAETLAAAKAHTDLNMGQLLSTLTNGFNSAATSIAELSPTQPS